MARASSGCASDRLGVMRTVVSVGIWKLAINASSFHA
jgi:hypothetical protein